MTTREVLNTLKNKEGIAFFNARKTDKEIYEILVPKGLTDSYETFISESQKVLAEKVSTMSKEELLSQIEGAELTDEQLEMIAGGEKGAGEIIGIGFGSAIGFAVLGTAAAG